MVNTFGNNIVSAFTGGVPVKEIYNNGVKVWPVDTPTPTPLNNEIWYTTYSGNPITLTDATQFGVNLVSNSYDSTKGVYVLEFDGVLTQTGTDSFKDITDLRSVQLPQTVKNIGLRTFFRSGLQSIIMPSVVTIYGLAFYKCSNLNPILILPSTCKTFTGGGFGACFEYCSTLTDVTLPAVCEYLGPALFRYCSNLSNVTVNATTPPEMGSGHTGTYEQFTGCSSNLIIRVPNSSLQAYKTAPVWSEYSDIIIGY